MFNFLILHGKEIFLICSDQDQKLFLKLKF